MRFKTQVFQRAGYFMLNTTTEVTFILAAADSDRAGTLFRCVRQAPSQVAKHKAPKRLRALYLNVLLILMFNLWCFGSQLVQFATVVKTEYVSAGVGGMRDVGSGTITVSGIPPESRIKFAYLYWHGPTNSADPNVNANVQFNGTSITGTNIGISGDNNWGFQNSQAYRADVTSLITAAGNGTYLLTGFQASPNTIVGGANTNGASLIIFYDDGIAANYRDVVLLNGNDSNGNGTNCPLAPADQTTFDAAGWNATASGIQYSGGTANLQLHVADGQAVPDDALLINGNVLVGVGPIFQGDSVPSANNGPQNDGSLWDIKNFDITAFLTTDGLNTLTVTTGVYQDCLSLVAAVFDLPSNTTAPSQTAQPQPVT